MRSLLLISFFLFLAGLVPVFAASSWEYYQAGMRFYNQHDYSPAARYFRAAVQEDPSNWQAYQALGMCNYEMGNKSAARQSFDQSLRLHPDNPQLARFEEGMENPGLSSASAAHGSGSPPVIGGGNFGIGLDFGGPGTWGATGKYWLDPTSAFQGALKLDGTVLQFQYLWHDYDVIHPAQGAFPFYIGVGGDLAVGGGIAIAGCVPIGITYLFQKKTVPLDLFVEGVPTLWFTNGIVFQLYGNIGSRFYF